MNIRIISDDGSLTDKEIALCLRNQNPFGTCCISVKKQSVSIVGGPKRMLHPYGVIPASE